MLNLFQHPFSRFAMAPKWALKQVQGDVREVANG